MSAKDQFSLIIQRCIDTPDQVTSEIQFDPDAFERSALDDDAISVTSAALFQIGTMAFLLFDAQGKRLDVDAPDWIPRLRNFDEIVTRASRVSFNGRLMSMMDQRGKRLHILWAPLAETANWNLPTNIRSAIQSSAADKVALVAGGVLNEGPLETAVRGFGLSNLQQRAVVAVIRTGNGPAAAARLGITHGTVRSALVQAARKIGQPNTPALVRTVVAAAFGIFPEDVNSSTLLTEMLQITPRQAQIALLISTGASREEAAAALRVSAAVVRKELEFIYANLQVQTAAELSRLIVEVQALRAFARATNGTPGFLDPTIEPARFAMRPNGCEMIGWSDYGPSSGRPVLVVHSNWACRAVPRELLLALQKGGWRPISIDRPGFGATHLGRSTPEDPFSQAVDDTLQIMDQQQIGTVAVVARAGTHFVQTLKAAAPERVGAVVLVSPTLHTDARSKRTGIMGALSEAFKSPRLTERFFRMICAQITLERIEQLTRAVVKGTAVDEALCTDPQFIRDRFRAVRPFAAGNLMGGIYEQGIISRGGFDFPELVVSDWTILQGDADNHNRIEDVRDFWKKLFPKAPIICVPGGGRFLTSSHAALVEKHLQLMFEVSAGIGLAAKDGADLKTELLPV